MEKFVINSDSRKILEHTLDEFKDAHTHLLTLESKEQKYRYLQGKLMHRGFCHYTEQIHNVYFGQSSFVDYYKFKVEPYTAYWCDTPQNVYRCYSPLTIEETIKKRIDILEEILANS